MLAIHPWGWASLPAMTPNWKLSGSPTPVPVASFFCQRCSTAATWRRPGDPMELPRCGALWEEQLSMHVQQLCSCVPPSTQARSGSN